MLFRPELLESKRRLCFTRDAAKIYGCTMSRIRQMAREKLIWSRKLGDRAVVFDADEIERLAKEQAARRAEGKQSGKRPGGFSAA